MHLGLPFTLLHMRASGMEDAIHKVKLLLLTISVKLRQESAQSARRESNTLAQNTVHTSAQFYIILYNSILVNIRAIVFTKLVLKRFNATQSRLVVACIREIKCLDSLPDRTDKVCKVP